MILPDMLKNASGLPGLEVLVPLLLLPYLVVLIAGLLIVAFVPWFTLSLPNALGFRG